MKILQTVREGEGEEDGGETEGNPYHCCYNLITNTSTTLLLPPSTTLRLRPSLWGPTPLSCCNSLPELLVSFLFFAFNFL